MAGTNLFSAPNLMAQLVYGLGAPPDLESFNVSARRRLFGKATVTAAASGTNTAVVNLTVPDILTDKDGLVFEILAALVAPGDLTGHLTIIDTELLLLAASGGGTIVPLGTPEPTTLVPRVGTSLLFTPVPVLTSTDMDQWLKIQNAGGTGLFTAGSQPLQIQMQVSMVNNDAGAGHQFTLSFWCGYRFLNGLTGA